MLGAVAMWGCDGSEDLTAPTGSDGSPEASLDVALAAADIMVTNNQDSGPGSLRAAAEAANLDAGIKSIAFANGVGRIQLMDPVEFDGTQDLTIHGNNGSIDGPGSGVKVPQGAQPATCDDALRFTGGGDVTIEDLRVQDACGTGIYVEIPFSASGDVVVTLENVTAFQNGLFGLLVDDQVNNSPAGVEVYITDSTFDRNGYVGASDLDGVRVNEGGIGDIYAEVTNTRVTRNGADGLELDEKESGDVYLEVKDSNFDNNGPRDPEDLDDGLDIDEAGPGDLVVVAMHSSANNNYDEGWDFDEEDEGDIDLEFYYIEALGNVDENIKATEDKECEDNPTTCSGGGNIILDFEHVTASRSVAKEGIEAEELGDGNIVAMFENVEATGNGKVKDDGEEGIQLTEDKDCDEYGTCGSWDGDLTATLDQLLVKDNGDDGIQLKEQGKGDFSAEVFNSSITNNRDAGIDAAEENDGTGNICIDNVEFKNNDEPTDFDGLTEIC
jgi:hypothetical protein